MGLFNLFKKDHTNKQPGIEPYREASTNLIYNLLFCDDADLFKRNCKSPGAYPYNILFDENSSVAELQKVIDDPQSEPRIKMLAYNLQLAAGHKPVEKELFGVVVEVALDEGLDTLASFKNGTARYINHGGSIIIWETTDDATCNEITNRLFDHSLKIVHKIGPWDKARKPPPPKGIVRLSFLVSDGLYFGEGPINVLFNDPMAKDALDSATELMQFLTKKSLEQKKVVK